MNTIRRKFYILGIFLTITVAIGVLIQYIYLNRVITQDKKLNTIQSRENLGNQINYNIKYYSQTVMAVADFIAMSQWTEEEAIEYFRRLIKGNPIIRSIYYGDINNKLINSDDWNPPHGYDLTTREWYVKAEAEEDLIISDVYIDELEDIFIITISKPIYENNKLLGVVAADITMEEIIKMVDNMNIKEVGYSFLIDSKGTILAHPKYESHQNLRNIDSISYGIHEELRATIVGERELILDEVRGYLSYQPIEKTDWIIGSFISRDEFRGNSNDVWRMFFITLAISMVIFGSFAYLQRRHFLIPIYRLEQDIKQINIEKDMSYRISIKREDPFFDLRRTINFILNKTQEFFEQHEQDKKELILQHEELEASYNQLSAMDQELSQQYTKVIRSEEKLKKALDRNNAMIDALPDLLFVINNEGKFIDLQGSDETQLYIEKEKFLGKKLEDLFPLEITKQTEKTIQNVLKYGRLESFEYQLEMPVGIQYYEGRIAKCNESEVIVIVRNITERKDLENKLSYLSYHDQLTGLYNRRYFEEELNRLNEEKNLPLTIVMADVNGLKLINDSFGHKAGDELLISAAHVIKRGCRINDLIARIGGDEFIIVLPKTAKREAEDMIEKIKKLSIGEKSSPIELSISFGWATKLHGDVDISEILKEAENDMYSHKLFEGPSMRSKTVETIIKTLYEKNKREEHHSRRVSKICKDMGLVLGMKEDEIKELESAGLLHDIGKIAINEAILDKPGSLNADEWKEMKKHPEIGYRILSTVYEMSTIAEYILAHHERYDGQGYPKGLKGEAIPLISRIITIADSYDAMASDRPYRKGLSNEEIIKEFNKHAGTQFDPYLSQIFIEKVLKDQYQ